MTPPKSTLFETELYELQVPGRILGREIIDAKARRIGICHSVKVRFATTKKGELKNEIVLVVKGLDVEFDIPLDAIEVIGNIIKLKIPANQAEEVQVGDVVRLQEDLAGEVRVRASRL